MTDNFIQGSAEQNWIETTQGPDKVLVILPNIRAPDLSSALTKVF